MGETERYIAGFGSDVPEAVSSGAPPRVRLEVADPSRRATLRRLFEGSGYEVPKDVDPGGDENEGAASADPLGPADVVDLVVTDGPPDADSAPPDADGPPPGAARPPAASEPPTLVLPEEWHDGELLARADGLVAVARVRREYARREQALRSRAMAAVAGLRRRFRRMADAAPIMIWSTDPAGETDFLSRSWYEFTGQDPEDGTGFGWIDAVHPEDAARARAAFRAAVEAQGPFRVEYRLRHAEDGYRWVIDAATPHVDEGGRFRGFIGTVIDVTDQKQIEAALRTSEEQFRTLANSIPQLAWMARPDGYIFWYNQRWYDYTGTTPEDMLGWGWRSVHDPAELERVESKYRAAVEEGTPWEDTFPLRRHDGEMHWHLSRAMPLRDDAGEIVLWFGTNTDITDRMRMEAALREADHRKDRFLATLAHELRNPLAPLVNGLEMLRQGPSPSVETRIQGTMERQLENMTRLVNDLLDVSRVSLGKVELQVEPIDLVEIVEMAVETVRPSLVARDHELSLRLTNEPVRLAGDRTRLEQIVSNLLQNAVKYTHPGGNIELRLEVLAGGETAGPGGDPSRGDMVRLVVQDDGIGIEQSTQAGIFDLFVQGDSAEDRNGEGLGIGLTIVRQLVHLHGGTISVESAGPGTGSRFTVTLPVSDAARKQPREPVAPLEQETEARRVLVVDDNENAAEMLMMLLDVLGHEVETVGDGFRALEVGPELRPHVVLLDIGLPTMDGYETCRRMRRETWGEQARIVAVTGWGQDEDRQRSKEAGFDLHLVKPVSTDALKDVLRPGAPPRSLS